MKTLLTNNKAMVSTAFIFGIVGLVLSLSFQDFETFSRFGALIVGLGIIILSRTFISGNDLLHPIKMAETGLYSNSREHYKQLGQSIPETVVEDKKNRFALGVLGPAVSSVGTLIWGFGDLLNYLVEGFGKNC